MQDCWEVCAFANLTLVATLMYSSYIASRPAHYIVLENEAPLGIKKSALLSTEFHFSSTDHIRTISSNSIQTLTFHLCHQYASATRSVSIPAPVYCKSRDCFPIKENVG